MLVLYIIFRASARLTENIKQRTCETYLNTQKQSMINYWGIILILTSWKTIAIQTKLLQWMFDTLITITPGKFHLQNKKSTQNKRLNVLL